MQIKFKYKSNRKAWRISSRAQCTQWQSLMQWVRDRRCRRESLLLEGLVQFRSELTDYSYNPKPFSNLSRFMTPERLRIAAELLNEYASPGMDKQTVEQFKRSEDFEALAKEVRSKRYMPAPLRMVYIPQLKEGKNEPRKLGIPVVRGRTVDRAWLLITEPILEGAFQECSYGYRPGRSCHQAIDDIASEINRHTTLYVLDADLIKCFERIKHAELLGFIKEHITDGVFLDYIRKLLQVYGDANTGNQGIPQGGVISPALANLYLHHVIDLYFEFSVKPRLAGPAVIYRYADDFIVLTTSRADAVKAMEMIEKQVRRYGTDLHPGKTHIRKLTSPAFDPLVPDEAPRELPFLGFDLYWYQTGKKAWELKAKTHQARRERSITNWKQYLHQLSKDFRKVKKANKGVIPRVLLTDLMFEAEKRIRGYQAYYGAESNETDLRLQEEGIYREGAVFWAKAFGTDGNPFTQQGYQLWPTARMAKLTQLSHRSGRTHKAEPIHARPGEGRCHANHGS